MALLACIGGLFAAGTEGGRALNGDGSGSWPPPEDNCSFRISSKSFPPKAEKCRKHAGLRYGVRRAKTRAISQLRQEVNRCGSVDFLTLYRQIDTKTCKALRHACRRAGSGYGCLNVTTERDSGPTAQS